jgi:high affinity sulfate transporter 1
VIGARIPGVAALAGYRRPWLSHDIVAGLVLSALLVPEGMAYAELAGLPAVTGLYTSVLCLVGYAVFGPSRILVLGPDSALGPMIAATILPLVGANGDPVRAVALASMLAILTGVIMVSAGLVGLGFVADLLSKPTMLGYMNGLSVTIVVSQLPKLLGFSVDADGFVDELRGLVSGVAHGDVVPAAAAVGLAALLVILLLQSALPKVPAVLVAVVASIAASIALDLSAHGVTTVGVLPQGLPSFTVPDIGLADLGPLVAGALGVTLVVLADTISTASSFADRRGEDVDGNKEMVGLGAANLAAGAFQGFPVSTSGSRTAVAEQAGAKSQLTGLVGALVIAAMLIAVPGLLADLPQATLGAVVIAAALSLADLPATRRLWLQRRADFALSVAAFLGVVLLGVLPGIVLAVVMSVANVFRRVWWPNQVLLGRTPGTTELHDVERHDDAQLLPGCAILRFDAPLIFANARTFRDRVRSLSEGLPPGGWIIVAAEPITDVDTTACDMLDDLDAALDARGQMLVFAEMKAVTRAKVAAFRLGAPLPKEHYFPTLDAAVAAYQRESGQQWQDPAPDL